MLENKNLRKKTEEIRKEKLGLCSLLENYRNKKESFKKRYDELKESNEKAYKSK
jgi:hypothetical protein